jgi:type I restriction enzyme S subunit
MLCDLYDGEKQSGIERINLDVKFLRGQSSGTKLNKGRYAPSGTTLILVDGENSGEIFTTPIEGYQGSTFKQLQMCSEIYSPFILYVIRSHQKQLRENKVGSAIPHLNKKLFRDLDIFVPPYQEQIRIVKKIDDTFATLDSISAEL